VRRMPRPATISPTQILDAAALEFAERGYAGARVDRIARRARVNKAMLYYHFGSKQSLYRALLRQIFSHAADRLQQIASTPLPAYFMMLAPIVFYPAGEPIRKELAARRLANVATLTPAVFVQQLQQTVRLAFAIREQPPSRTIPGRRRAPDRSSARRERL